MKMRGKKNCKTKLKKKEEKQCKKYKKIKTKAKYIFFVTTLQVRYNVY